MRSRSGGAACCLALALLLGLLAAPAAQAQSGALYFRSTGHHLSDDQGFLSFWRVHDGERLLGFAVTEAFEADGRVVQYFMKGRLELETDPATAASHVRTGRVAAEYAEALFRVFPPAPPRRSVAGEQVFPETGHMLRSPFLDFWRANGGQAFFGAPISETTWELTERGQRQVQYFERARLEREPSAAGTPDSIQVGDLGRALALLRGLDTTPIANWGAEPYGPSAPAIPDAARLATPAPPPPPTAAPPARPAPVRATAAPEPPRPQAPRGGNKRIVVNLSDQWLYAFEGGRQVFDAPVSTGRDGMNTPTGGYAIYAKLKIQTMSGETDGVPWVVPNVPNVMYIKGGVALHGTYWHHRFGSGARLSHGCINLSLEAAAWLFDWAPLGTPVRVTY